MTVVERWISELHAALQGLSDHVEEIADLHQELLAVGQIHRLAALEFTEGIAMSVERRLYPERSLKDLINAGLLK
ncbi:Uncharacterised protein [Mycobacteroides abscessus subsp. abscessus]|uniref:hypothetical protein n=1 Tax=Mycobacteroides abscessus TaxID=36809 RepID=UPI00092C3243|nr:hypothetical protein [Mycobacteroides abscessus]SIH37282.1 Uncharacterised protein [Mycobacteroides abscessus subsp. abscessus]